MSKSLGATVRMARESKKLTREQLAKKANISAGYIGHIERDAHVRLSPKLLDALKKILGRLPISEQQVEAHNERSRKYYAAYRKKPSRPSAR